MRTLVVAALLVSLVACAATDPGVARDPADGSGGASTAPDPTPEGRVRTLGPAMVMDTGRPELCLGPIAESWPPQCSGPPIEGWDWSAYDGAFERQGDVRWGEFALTGRWDGATFEVTEVAPRGSGDPVEGLDPVSPEEASERLRTVVIVPDRR